MKSLPNIQEQIKILGSELNVMSDMLKSIDDVCFLKDDESKGLENLSKKISEQHLYNTYSGINKYLAEKDEYQKSLYIRMLCVVVQYGGSIENGQEAYLQKLIKDCQLENKLEDFLREALCFDMEEFKAFIEVVGNNILSCYFCIDSLILVSFEQNSEEKYNLLADIFCALGITKDELQFFSKVSCSVVEQKGELFDEAKESVPDSVEYQDFIFYVKDFYEESPDNAYHFYSKELTELTEDEFKIIQQNKCTKYIKKGEYSIFQFTDSKFVFKNRVVRYMTMKFKDCSSVSFINCAIYIDSDFTFIDCIKVHFVNCSIILLHDIFCRDVATFLWSGCNVIAWKAGLFQNGIGKILLENNDLNVLDVGSCYNLQKIAGENMKLNNWYGYNVRQS